MDWIDRIWPDDLSQVQYGPLSAWVGSLLTGCSLLLGFYILLRDRCKEERAQARQVTTDLSSTTTYYDTGPINSTELQIHNGSTSAIFDVEFVLTPLSARRIKRYVRNFATEIANAEKAQLTDQRVRVHVARTKMAVLDEQLPMEGFGNTKARDTITPGDTKLLVIDMLFDLSWYEAHLTFADLAGNIWVRDVIHDTFRRKKRRKARRRPRPVN